MVLDKSISAIKIGILGLFVSACLCLYLIFESRTQKDWFTEITQNAAALTLLTDNLESFELEESTPYVLKMSESRMHAVIRLDEASALKPGQVLPDGTNKEYWEKELETLDARRSGVPLLEALESGPHLRLLYHVRVFMPHGRQLTAVRTHLNSRQLEKWLSLSEEIDEETESSWILKIEDKPFLVTFAKMLSHGDSIPPLNSDQQWTAAVWNSTFKFNTTNGLKADIQSRSHLFGVDSADWKDCVRKVTAKIASRRVEVPIVRVFLPQEIASYLITIISLCLAIQVSVASRRSWPLESSPSEPMAMLDSKGKLLLMIVCTGLAGIGFVHTWLMLESTSHAEIGFAQVASFLFSAGIICASFIAALNVWKFVSQLRQSRI